MSNRIIDEALVREAIKLAQPTVAAILAHNGATWGPKWVTGRVMAPGLETDKFEFEFSSDGPKEEWNSGWGDPLRFYDVAEKKLAVAEREKTSTSVVVATRAWCLEEGEYLFPGGVHRDGISVSASGAKGRADEAIAEVVLSLIIMLANLKTDLRIEYKQTKIMA
ncbi:MAG: hypothetical protein US63_C0003G0006 [Candidatus Moranbacteria bacterium GW2011_GWC2_37_8]|nr:MAG: hypothetical protein US63_C0003G0006 [Candidatus Moranbacteria bacterium GW2011_GWC2_37_8]KKQ63211.1 MAG: hypothetical protein US82_C0002G0006 [Parcubacteria group bacterium GW2011_GWC1_38_22]